MARHILSARQVEAAKPKDRPYLLRDGDGLYLRVATSGVKSWQFRYVHQGKQQVATLGRFPDWPLDDARLRANEARRLASDGFHVTTEKRRAKAMRAAATSSTFGSVSKAWIARRKREDVWTDAYVQEVENSLANHLEKLNNLPIADVRAAVCAPMLAKVERSAPDMARKVRQRLRSILDFAVETGLIDVNPLPAVRRRRFEREHLPAVLDRTGVGDVLRSADVADVSRGVRRAHLLLAFTAQRVGEVVPAEWQEIDLEQGLWTIPRHRMKRKAAARGDHVVPLPPQLLAQMKEWHRADGDKAVYVCPSPRGDFVTREAVEKFYRETLKLKDRHSPHSWRSVLSTWSRDAGKDADVVEAQLDHVTGTATQTAYDRAKRLDRRRELMAWHEESLLAARDGAKVIAITREATEA